jgi:hypothetical protein
VHAAENRWRDRPLYLEVSAMPEFGHRRFPVGGDLAARMLALQMRRSLPRPRWIEDVDHEADNAALIGIAS